MKKLAIILVLLITLQVSSNAQFSVKGEFRPRAEFDHGLKKLAVSNQDVLIWTAQRTRLNFDYASDIVSSKISLQDVRTWGSQSQLNTVDGLSSIHEAWIQAKLSEKFSLKVGRQELVYDDHRIFGNVDWATQGRSHDIALLKFNNNKHLSADLGFAYNQNQVPSTPFTVVGNYKAMQYLWLHKDIKEKIGISILFLNNGNQLVTVVDSVTNSYSTVYSQTAGVRMSYKHNENLKMNAAGYFQMGTDAVNRTLSAYYATADFSLLLLEKKLSIGGGYELLSGTDQNSISGKNNSFTPFYGTNHKFNGHMDYFYVGNHINSVGLQDIFFQLAYKAGKLSPGLDFHIFSSEALIYDNINSKSYENALGNEIDFYIGYKHNELVSFKGGYSQMFGTKSMEFLRGGNSSEMSNWGWIMLSVSPRFFESN